MSNFTNSPLTSYARISGHSAPRTHAIDTITIHCYVGQVTAQQGCDYFATTDKDASANYVVGHDGSIGLCVPESNRSFCSSNSSNDDRAVTIEVACEPTHPYKVTDQALSALIELVTDVCCRNSIKELKWKADKSLIGQIDKQNMTVHRWFADKACPGDYLYNLHGKIAQEVNAKMNNGIKYRVHQQTYGWSGWKNEGEDAGVTGQAKRLEAIQIDPNGKQISVKAHIQGIGWVDYCVVTKDTIIGTTGQAKRLEAIEIHGAMVQCHIQTIGWASGYSNLQGTTGLAKRIEAVRIKSE